MIVSSDTVFMVRLIVPNAKPKNYIAAVWDERQAHWFLQQTIGSMWDKYTYKLRQNPKVKIAKAEFVDKKDPADALKLYFDSAYQPFESKTSSGLHFRIDEVLLPNKNETEWRWSDEISDGTETFKANENLVIELFPEYKVSWVAKCERLGGVGEGETKEEAIEQLATDLFMQFQTLKDTDTLEDIYEDGANEMALVYQEVFPEAFGENAEVWEEEGTGSGLDAEEV